MSPRAPAVTRAGAILDVLAGQPGSALGLSDLSRRLDLPKSSIANICASLVDIGWLRRADGGFALGRKLVELGGAYLSGTDLIQDFYASCEELETASEETVQLAVLDDLEVTYIARHDGRQPIRIASALGRRLPANCTALGKSALAALERDVLAERLRGVRWLPAMTAQSIRTVDALLQDLDGVRARGYAIDDGETTEGIVCFAVSIPSRRLGEGPFAASVTLLKARATPDRQDALVADLQKMAVTLSASMRPNGSPRAEPRVESLAALPD